MHGMQEVGGSIPPGSTTLRPSGYAWRSHELPEGRSVVSGVARRAKTDWFNWATCSINPSRGDTLRCYAWRSHELPEGRSVVSGVARRAKTDWFNWATCSINPSRGDTLRCCAWRSYELPEGRSVVSGVARRAKTDWSIHLSRPASVDANVVRLHYPQHQLP